MKSIIFECNQLIPLTAVEICTDIADLSQWSNFSGYGVIPSIKHATYEKRTAEMVGSRIRVQNSDGSTHVEEIYKWLNGKEVAMKFCEFDPPLRYLATHFTEVWKLEDMGSQTAVTRRFEMYPRFAATRPLLWMISLVFRKAINQQLKEMSEGRRA